MLQDTLGFRDPIHRGVALLWDTHDHLLFSFWLHFYYSFSFSVYRLVFPSLSLHISLFLPPISSPLNERTIPQPFLVLKRAFTLFSNWSLPRMRRLLHSQMATLGTPVQSQSQLAGVSAFQKHHQFLTESIKDWHHGAIERTGSQAPWVISPALSTATCMALYQAGSEHSYL